MVDMLCNFLFMEEASSDNVSTLYPLTIKYEGKLTQIRSQGMPRIQYAASLSIDHLADHPKNDKSFVIVGAGPTIYGFVDSLLEVSDSVVCSINKAHEFLIKRDIIPNMHILYERDITSIQQSLGGEPHKDVTYYVCSMCDENIFKQLEGYRRVLWNTEIANDYQGDYGRLISSTFPGEPLIGVGYTSFLKAFGIGQMLGHTKYEFYGIDCSIPLSGPTYIDEYGGHDTEDKFYIWASNRSGELRKYYVNVTLMTQAVDFVKYFNKCRGLDVKIYGDGLLGFVYRNRSR